MNPIEELQALNRAAIEGKPDVVGFLERNFNVSGNWFNHRPIKFEQRQKDNVIKPVRARDANGRRRWKIFLTGMAKKNGKSKLSAALVMYALFLDDPNPEVYSAAGDLDQARIIYRGVAKAFESSPLRHLVRIGRDTIERIDAGGFYQALPADAPGSHGKNATANFWDEIWNQPSYDL